MVTAQAARPLYTKRFAYYVGRRKSEYARLNTAYLGDRLPRGDRISAISEQGLAADKALPLTFQHIHEAVRVTIG